MDALERIKERHKYTGTPVCIACNDIRPKVVKLAQALDTIKRYVEHGERHDVPMCPVCDAERTLEEVANA